MPGFPVALRTILPGSVWSPEERLVGRVEWLVVTGGS